MKNKFKNTIEEIAFFLKMLFNKIKGIPLNKYAGMYVLQPKFGGTFVKKVDQEGQEIFIFLAGHKGAEMFTKEGANKFIKIYNKADKDKTRFVIIKKRVTVLLAEIERETQEQEQQLAAQNWNTEEKAKLN